jgi:hypothetical protein
MFGAQIQARVDAASSNILTGFPLLAGGHRKRHLQSECSVVKSNNWLRVFACETNASVVCVRNEAVRELRGRLLLPPPVPSRNVSHPRHFHTKYGGRHCRHHLTPPAASYQVSNTRRFAESRFENQFTREVRTVLMQQGPRDGSATGGWLSGTPIGCWLSSQQQSLYVEITVQPNVPGVGAEKNPRPLTRLLHARVSIIRCMLSDRCLNPSCMAGIGRDQCA